MDQLPADDRPAYAAAADCLDRLGYHPQRERGHLSFKHRAHSKQIAKIGLRRGAPFLALRFSGCQGYSPRFAAVVARAIAQSPSKTPRCPEGGCNFCAGPPETHIYRHTLPDGTQRAHCGAYALEIPGFCQQDLPELAALIAQEHAYLLAHEAGRA